MTIMLVQTMSDRTVNTTGVDLFVEALAECGIVHVFDNSGTTELPLLRSIGDNNMKYVLGLHEDIAVGMVAGYAMRRRYHSYADQSVNPLGVVKYVAQLRDI